ncbi:MAG: SHOCT domain-containing protein [Solirubrobacterales bacterium]
MESAGQPARSAPAPRRGVVTALLVVATLLAFVSAFSIWVNRQALNTDNWVDTSSKLLDNQEIQDQLSIFLVNELYANVDVQAELAKSLPPQLKPLAGPAAGGLRQLGTQVAQKALATPQVQQLWADANRAASETLLKILNGGGPAVSTGGGEVVLNLNGLVTQLSTQLGVGGNLASKIPADAGSITILKSDQLSTAQDVAHLIKGLAVVLTILVFGLYALALFLARGRRRETLRSVGFGFLIAGILTLVVRHFVGDQIVNALASSSVKPAAQSAWDIGTSLLRTIAISMCTFGILVVIGAWLAGPTRAASALRREAAPYLRERRGASYAVVALVFLALVLWAPVTAFQKPIGFLLLAVLMVLGTEALRRQTELEFPGAQAGGLWDRARQGLGRHDRGAADDEGQGKLDQLERLSALREKGLLSDEELAQAKTEVLGGAAPGERDGPEKES